MKFFFVPLFHLWEGGGGPKPKMEISIFFFFFDPFPSVMFKLSSWQSLYNLMYCAPPLEIDINLHNKITIYNKSLTNNSVSIAMQSLYLHTCTFNDNMILFLELNTSWRSTKLTSRACYILYSIIRPSNKNHLKVTI